MSLWRQLTRGIRKLTSRDAQDEVAHYFAEALAAGAALPGDEERVRDQLRAAGWETTLSDLAADLRYAARQLRHNPGFTVAAVVVLALGMGVSTAMFSVLNAALLRSLPYAQPNRLMTLAEPSSMSKLFWGASYPDVTDWRRANHSFSSIAFYRWNGGTLEGRDQSLEVGDYFASPNLFSTLGRLPFRVRSFTPQDVASHAAVAILNYALWQKWFHGQPALGKLLRLDGKDYQVVGILPQGLRFPYEMPADLWLPYIPPVPARRDGSQVLIIGRLRPAITPAAAQAELSAIQAHIARQYANLHLPARVEVESYAASLTGAERPPLLALALAVALVWLIACASVAGLMLTRLAARRRELAVRAALGAGRLRLARQLLSESMVVGILAALAGWALAAAALAALRPFLLPRLPYVTHIGLSAAALGALAVATLISVVLIGLVPALGAGRTPAAAGLHDRSLGTSRAQTRLRHALVTGEIALALLLLAGAGLLLRTLDALNQVPLGFNTAHILTTRLSIPHARYAQQSIYLKLEAPLLQKIEALPGVAAAGISSVVPLGSNFIHIEGSFGIVGKPQLLRSQQPEGDMRYTSAGYPRVFGIPVLRGRFFNPALDTPTSQPVAVINQALAQKYFAGQNPIGQQLDIGKHKGATIIGVLANAHMQGVGTPPEPVVHFAASQLAPQGSAPFYSIGAQFVQLAVRSYDPPTTLANSIRHILHRIAPEVAAGKFLTETQLKAQSLGDQTFAADLLASFAGAALLIALAGLYGLLAYTVAQRRREMGIRLALGASPAQIRSLVLRNAGWMIAAGIFIGLSLALALTKVMAAYLYGVAPRDPLTLAAAAALLALCALAAAWLPARRAAGIEPLTTLRSD